MEQESKFGIDLSWLVLQKKTKIWADYEQLLRPFFSSFRGPKNNKNKNIVNTIKLHKMKSNFFFHYLLFSKYRLRNIFNCVLLQ
jgi:hypothetical protein